MSCQAMLTAPRHHPVVAAGPIATMQLHGFATEGAIFAPRVFSALSTLPVVKTRGLTDGRCFFVDSASRMFFFTWKVIFCCAKVQLRPARTQIFGCPKKHEQGNDINDNEKRKVKTGKCQMKVYQTAEEVLRSKAAATSCSASRSPQ